MMMTNNTVTATVLCALTTCCACVNTGQERVDVSLSAVGSDVAGGFTVDTDWQVTLDNTQLAFGPLYLCAGSQAGALCETARAEWTDSAVIDVLDPTVLPLGTMNALTGPVRSWMYDLGVASLLTQQQPVLLDAANELGGNSLRMTGTATRGGDSIAFSVELVIQQDQDTEAGVSVVRSAPSDDFDHDVVGGGETLVIAFDPRTWLSEVDFDQLCDETLGCPATAEFAPNSQAWRAIRNQLVAGQRPVFEFTP